MLDIDALKKTFAELYGGAPGGIVQAPGRVNLIGEHTDYNEGFVLPIAIERHTLAAYTRRPDPTVRVASLQRQGQLAEFNLDKPIETGPPKWANYPKGVAAGLIAAGVAITGADILFDSDVPVGGGLSSSASLEVAAAFAMLAAADNKVDDRELALLCQKAEHDFAGAPCGIMDQSIAIMAEPGRALLLDCRSGKTRQIPFDDPAKVLLVADTQVRHDLADGGYAARRDQCYSAAKKLGIKMLRDACESDLAAAEGELTEKELMRARHVVGEIRRTLEAVAAMEAGDYDRFGRLMYASHASLRDDYQVSCEELDAIVEAARECEGVYGARMTGGGFGGCAIILADADKAGRISETVATEYERRFSLPCAIFATRAAGGAGVVG